MKRLRWSVGLLLGSLCAWAPSVGCGGSDLECGAGTVKNGSTCTPAVSSCAPGTVAENGTCVPQCTTTQQWNGSTCVVTPQCGAGSKAVSGKCVPACSVAESWDGTKCAAITACAKGTTLNTQTGACEPSADVCGAGATWKNGQCVADLTCGTGTHSEGGACVPDAALPAADVSESPNFDGYVEFPLPAAGDDTVLGGAVDPPEGFSYPDWDRFRFTAQAGTWLKIEAMTSGPLHPSFDVQSLELGTDNNPRYLRYRLEPNSATATREVYLPIAGTYELRITDYAHMLASIFPDTVSTLPVGGPEFQYAIKVTNLGKPTPETVALPATKTGDLTDGSLHFFTVQGLQVGDALTVSSMGLPPPSTESDAFRAVMAFAPDGSFMGQGIAYQTYGDAEIPVVATSAGDHLIVQDCFLTIGSREDYALDLATVGVSQCTGTTCQPGSMPAGNGALIKWDLNAGDFFVAGVYLPGDAAEYVKVSVYDGAMQPAVADSAASAGSVGAGYLYAEKATSAYVWLREWDGLAVPAFYIETATVATPAFTSGNSYSSQPLAEMPPYTLKNPGIGHFDAKAGQVVFFSQFTTYPSGEWVSPQEMIMTQRLDPMGPVIDTQSWLFPDGFVTPLFTYIKQDGQYLHYTYDGNGGVSGATYDVRMSLRDTVALGAPAVGAPVSAKTQTLAQGSMLYTFEGKANQYYDITVSPTLVSNMIPDLWVFNFGRAEFVWVSYEWKGDLQSNQLGLITRLTGTTSDDITAGYVSPYDGPTMLLVQTSDGSGTFLNTFDVSVNAPAAPANDTCATATVLTPDTSGHASFSGTSAAAGDNVSLSGCTDYATPGPDMFFSLSLQDGDTVDITLTTTEFSAALYLFTDCADSKSTCRATSESGSPRHIIYKVPAGMGGVHYIAADAHKLGGAFQLDVQVTSN